MPAGRSGLLIEGPYDKLVAQQYMTCQLTLCTIGGPGHAIFTSFSAVVMIIGGSCITFSPSTIQDLAQKGLRGGSCVKMIELVGVVQTEG